MRGQHVTCRAAFTCFDWTGNGKISTHALLPAMRRAGTNPTEVEVHDILNKIDDGSGVITFEDFCSVLHEKENFKTFIITVKGQPQTNALYSTLRMKRVLKLFLE